MEKKLRKKIKDLSVERNIPESVVQRIFESQFRFAKDKIETLELLELTEEEFKKKKTDFNFKYIGKLFTKYRFVKAGKKQWEKKNAT